MSFLEKMQKRYTVKKYDSQAKVDPEKINELKAILNLSPSSINSQPWNFVFINDQQTKEKLSEISYHNKEKVIECSDLIVFQVLKNVEDFEKQIHENLPEGAVGYYNSMVKPKGDLEIKFWMRNQVYLSLGVLLSACADMEVDCTPMEGIMPEKYDEIIQNDAYESVFAVAIGKKSEEDKNQPTITPKKRLATEKVVVEI